MKFDIHTLDNGLRIILAPMPGTDTASVMVMTGTGSRYETDSENGLAHFLEHMFFKGTKKRPTARDISEELDGVGAEYNAFTAKERTAYYAKISKDYVDTALDVILDICLNSTLPPEEIDKERGAVVQEIGMYEDMPIRSIGNYFDELLYGTNHPLGRTILGPKENILSFSREQFIEYHSRCYGASNTVVCIAGAFDTAKALDTIRKSFGGLPRTAPPQYTAFTGAQNEPRVFIKEKNTDQTQLMLGVPAYPYEHKDEFALEVLSAILGSGMSSRLFLEIREKRGLAYFVRTMVDRYPDIGAFVMQAGVEHAKLGETVQTSLAEFKRIRDERVSDAELAKAKAHIIGTLALQLETSDEIAEHASTSLINIGKIRSLEDIRTGINAVTSADVQRVAEDILKTEKLNLAVIGPHSDKEALRGLLAI